MAIFNITFLDVYGPFRKAGLALMLLAGIVVARERAVLALTLVGFAAAHHVMMASFDGFGERHALVALPAISGLIGLASRHLLGLAAAVVALGLSVAGTADLSARYYGDEDTFVALLEQGEYAELPRLDIRDVPPKDCGWVAEDARVAADPVASHFNVLRPEEEASLRGSDGCLRWCGCPRLRWSFAASETAPSACRTSLLTPRHVVTDPGTGYACLVMDVGQRTVPIPGSQLEDHEAASRRDHPVP